LQNWLIWPDNIVASVLVLVLIAMAGLYAARAPMHGMIRAAGYALASALRLAARWLFAAATVMKERNKAVLLAQGRREVGQRIEREFERVGVLVTRDLQGYPVLQRKLLESITRIEEDYKKCGEVPPPPPDWVEAVAAVAEIKTGGGEVVQKILDEIRQSVERIHEKALGEYRRAYEERHDILESAQPFWRSIEKTLKLVDKKFSDLADNAAAVDTQMKKYQKIAAKSDEAETILSNSAFTQFNISVIVLTIALGGAFVNFKLIALPMSEMVGAGDYITASLRTSEVAALVIILVEASMGLFLMEALRITHLFPRISNLSESARRRMVWISLTLLVILASVEAALALMRDMLIADKQALLQSLAATAPAAHTEGWVGRIPLAGQMVLGFILPFALAFVAVPLESFIHSARNIGGSLFADLVRMLGFVLRVLGNLTRHLTRLLLHFYDLLVVLPLMVEHLVKSVRSGARAVKSRRLDSTGEFKS
ncbi:MAG TPA: hypothetical protein VLB72_16690, partial [Burkholderiales bacterium]|nr:hypothetical protein [Burkholderiales bacterium]